MNGALNKENITRVVVALMIAAIGYLFNMIYDVRHAVHITQENQAQIKRQWPRISTCEKDIAVNKNNIDWLKCYMRGNK